jgi:hypothetical protein
MTATLTNIKREISDLQQIIDGKFNVIKHFIIFSYSSPDEPHGVFGYQGFFVGTSKKLAVSLEYEYEDLKKRYETEDNETPLIYEEQRIKNRLGEKYFKHCFPTFQSFLENKLCKCGKHGVKNNKPFGEVCE